MNIVLIGYRGTGKTSIARLLSEALGRPAVSLDGEIVRKAGLSIPEIVERSGWDRFRDLETEVLRETISRDGIIVDSGGGVILRDENTRMLRENGFVVLLLAGRDTIVKRIAGSDDRPSLSGEKSFTDEVEEILRERMPKYLSAADIQIDTEGPSPEGVVEQIISELKARNLLEGF